MKKLYCSLNFFTNNSLLSLGLVTEFGDMFYAELNNNDIIPAITDNIYIDKDKSSLCFLKHTVINHYTHIYYNDIDKDIIHHNVFLKNHSNIIFNEINKWLIDKDILLITDVPQSSFFKNISFNYQQLIPNYSLELSPLVKICTQYFEHICNCTNKNNALIRALHIMNTNYENF